jgi:hypothetical protein
VLSTDRSGRRWLSTEARAVGWSVAALLALAVPIDVGPRDDGELSSAAWVLGVAHPSGAPVSIAFASLFARLPLGTIAYRQGLAMAVAMAVAVAFFADVIVQQARGLRRWLAAAIVGAVALAPTLLRAGTMTEVYAPTLALCAVAFWLEARAAAGAPMRARHLFAIGALVGLALGAHAVARLLVPVALVAPTLRALRTRGLAATCGHGLVGFASSVPMVGWVPIAARRLPPVSFGDPRTLRTFFRHFMAIDVQAAFATRTAEADRLRDARELLQTTIADAGVAIPVLALVGAVVAWRARRRGVATLVAIVAIEVAYSIRINPMGIVDRQVGHALLVALAGLAAFAVVEVRSSLAAFALTLAALCAIGLRAAPELRGTDGRFVAEVWTIPGALSRVPAGAVVVCDGDDHCGGALYAQVCEGARPDVVIVPRSLIGTPSFFGPRMAAAVRELERALAADDRPILVEGGGDAAYPRPTFVDPARPLLRLGHPTGLADVAPSMLALDRAMCGERRDRCPPLTTGLLAQAHLGPIQSEVRAQTDGADALIDAALSLDPTMSALWTARSVRRATRGDLDGAIDDARTAIAFDGARVTPRANLVQWLFLRERDAEATEALDGLAARCRGCLSARILRAAARARQDGDLAPLDALEHESAAKHELWCRAFAIARRPPTGRSCTASGP